MNRNTIIKDFLIALFNTQQTQDIIPEVVPVADVTNYVNVIEHKDATGTVYSVPSKGRFFITGMEASCTKTAANTGALLRTDITLKGSKKVRRVCQIAGVTLVAQVENKLSQPMYTELEPGTNVTLTATGSYDSTHVTMYGVYFPE